MSSELVKSAALSLATVVVTASTALAQTPIWLLEDPSSAPPTGIDGAGDVDGDGFADVIVGWKDATATNYLEGIARVYSGSTSEILHEFAGGEFQMHLGYRVAGIGDVDGDGHADVACSCEGEVFGSTPVAPRLRVFSGATGQLLHEIVSEPGLLLGG